MIQVRDALKPIEENLHGINHKKILNSNDVTWNLEFL
jgi:hypothetical protein